MSRCEANPESKLVYDLSHLPDSVYQLGKFQSLCDTPLALLPRL